MKELLIWSVDKFFSIVYLLIFIRLALSWIRVNSYNKYIALIYQLTDPILEPFRTLMSKFSIDTGMIDFSPIIAYFVLELIESLIKQIIWLF